MVDFGLPSLAKKHNAEGREGRREGGVWKGKVYVCHNVILNVMCVVIYIR